MVATDEMLSESTLLGRRLRQRHRTADILSAAATAFTDHGSTITDQQSGISDDLFIDHYSLVIERRATAGSWSTVLPGSGGYTGQATASDFWNMGNASGGNGAITAPTSIAGSSGFGGSGSYGSGSNTISFNLGGGPSNQRLSSLASAVYGPMGGGPMPGLPSLPTAASSAAYMQKLEAQYPATIHAGVDHGISGLIQQTQTWNPISSGLGYLAGALSSWGQSEASGGNTVLGTAGMFLGGVANTMEGISNPVGSLLSLGACPSNVLQPPSKFSAFSFMAA